MNLSKEEEIEKIKAMVVGKVHLDPTFQQQFIQKPEESVLKSKTLHLTDTGIRGEGFQGTG